MLAASALRLAVIEALAPTAAIEGSAPFPTLAGWRVFDSAAITPDKLEPGQPWTPCLSVYTNGATITRRGASATSSIGEAEVDLVIVIDLAEAAQDENGAETAGVLVDGDAAAELTLDALAAQVRRVIVQMPQGQIARRLMKAALTISLERMTLPQFDVRFARYVMTAHCAIADDKFTDEPGLPEPLATLAAALPTGSYAKAKLIELAATFAATERTPLAGIDMVATLGGTPVIRPPAD